MEQIVNFIADYGITIISVIVAVVVIFKEVKKFMKSSKEEQIEIIKSKIYQTIVSLVWDAELDFADVKKSGELKRAFVIEKIYEKYPLLSKVVNQGDLVDWIDSQIDYALQTVKKILENNTKTIENDETKTDDNIVLL